jgi:hypothetical protein
MRAINVLVGCVACATAVAPWCAYKIRPAAFFDLSFSDDWFLLVLTNAQCLEQFRFALAACVAFGVLVGVALAAFLDPFNPKKEFQLGPFRSQIVAALMFPSAIMTIVFVAYNHTPEMLPTAELPAWLRSYWIALALPIGAFGAWFNGFVVDREVFYEKATVGARMRTLCCWPFAVLDWLVLVVGGLGCGAAVGALIGKAHGAPIAFGLYGTCVAAIVMAFSEDIFWPIYYPLSRLGR